MQAGEQQAERRTCTHESADGVRCEDQVQAGGLCVMHYSRRRQGRDMDAPKYGRKSIRGRRRNWDTCYIVSANGEPCGRRFYAGGLCETHYLRDLKGKDVDAPIQEWKRHDGLKRYNEFNRRICNYVFKNGQTCDLEYRSCGYCNPHYLRQKLGMDMDMPHSHKNKGFLCSAAGCKREARCRGLCDTHYSREARRRGLK